MDSLAAIAFGGEPALQRYMLEEPVKREANILSKYMVTAILTAGLYITACSVFFLTYEPVKELFVRDGLPNEQVFMSAFFNLFIFLIIFNGFNARTEKINLLDNLGKNKTFVQIIGMIIVLQVIFTYVGGTILRTTPLLPGEWFIEQGKNFLFSHEQFLLKRGRSKFHIKRTAFEKQFAGTAGYGIAHQLGPESYHSLFVSLFLDIIFGKHALYGFFERSGLRMTLAWGLVFRVHSPGFRLLVLL